MAFQMDTGQRLAIYGLDGQPAGDTSAFLRAVEVELPEERQDSAFHTDVANADKLADAWSLRDESHLRGSNDTNATMDVFAIAQAALIIMGGNLSPATKPCDSCGGEFEIGSFSRKEWIAAGWGRCRSCVQNGNPVRYSEYYRPAVPYSSKIDDSNLCHPDSLAAILRENLAEDYGEDCVERLIKAASEYPMTFKHYLRLYYYKYKLLSGLKKAGESSDVVNNVRRAIYDIPDYYGKDPTFRKITERIRQAMSKGKKKLRLACKEVFLATDSNSKRVPLNDVNEVKTYVADDVAEVLVREEFIDSRADEDEFVPSVARLVDDLVPMLNKGPEKQLLDLLFSEYDRDHPQRQIEQFQLCLDALRDRGIAGKFNRCVERQRDEFRRQRYKPTDPGLPLRRRCDVCYVDNALAEWRYPYCNSCNVYWLSPKFRRTDTVDTHCPICLRWPTPGEFSYTLRCGHTLHLKCLEYARSVKAEWLAEQRPGEKILSVCPVCSDPITDDLDKVVFVQDVWPTHKFWWPGEPPGFIEAADNGLRAAEGAYSTASAALRDLASFGTLTKIALDVWTEKNKATLNRATADLATEQELDEAASGLRDGFLTQIEELRANAARAEGERAAAARRVAALDAAQDKLAAAQDMVEASAAAALAAISDKKKNAALL